MSQSIPAPATGAIAAHSALNPDLLHALQSVEALALAATTVAEFGPVTVGERYAAISSLLESIVGAARAASGLAAAGMEAQP